MFDYINIEDIPHNHPVARFYHYWTDHLNADGIFVREDFNPMEVPHILPWVIIVEPADEERTEKFIIRLYGNGVATLLDRELTGQYVGSAISSKLRLELEQKFQSSMDDGKPKLSELPVPIEGREFIQMYHGVFPVFVEKKQEYQIFVIMADKSMQLSEQT